MRLDFVFSVGRNIHLVGTVNAGHKRWFTKIEAGADADRKTPLTNADVHEETSNPLNHHKLRGINCLCRISSLNSKRHKVGLPETKSSHHSGI